MTIREIMVNCVTVPSRARFCYIFFHSTRSRGSLTCLTAVRNATGEIETLFKPTVPTKSHTLCLCLLTGLQMTPQRKTSMSYYIRCTTVKHSLNFGFTRQKRHRLCGSEVR